jgi:hypothetical protein
MWFNRGAMKNNEPHAFKVGDKATHTIHTDSHAGYILHVSPNGKTVIFGRSEAKLLNGANSGEHDALEFSPGGFVGHTSGEQRWDIATEPMAGYRDKFTLRSNGRWKIAGGGTYSPGNTLRPGHHPHYDFNF